MTDEEKELNIFVQILTKTSTDLTFLFWKLFHSLIGLSVLVD